MEFVINNDKWKIKELAEKDLLKLYNEGHEDKASYIFGVTIYPKHRIYINNDMCYEQQRKTLKHELTHCYLWEYGMGSVDNFDAEMVCDILAGACNFVNETTNKYFKK